MKLSTYFDPFVIFMSIKNPVGGGETGKIRKNWSAGFH